MNAKKQGPPGRCRGHCIYDGPVLVVAGIMHFGEPVWSVIYNASVIVRWYLLASAVARHPVSGITRSATAVLTELDTQKRSLIPST